MFIGYHLSFRHHARHWGLQQWMEPRIVYNTSKVRSSLMEKWHKKHSEASARELESEKKTVTKWKCTNKIYLDFVWGITEQKETWTLRLLFCQTRSQWPALLRTALSWPVERVLLPPSLAHWLNTTIMCPPRPWSLSSLITWYIDPSTYECNKVILFLY